MVSVSICLTGQPFIADYPATFRKEPSLPPKSLTGSGPAPASNFYFIFLLTGTIYSSVYIYEYKIMEVWGHAGGGGSSENI
jgi:hypothetical protein